MMRIARVLLLAGCGLLTAARVLAADPAQQLEALKAKFPEMKTQQAEVSGKGMSSKQSVEVKMPPADVWAKYHGPVAAATLATLPGVISRLEAAIKADNGVLLNHQKTLVGGAAKAQARVTSQWLTGPLAGYLKQLKALVPAAK
jgi:hypothetical protein